jgi:hypothetical protein
VGTGVNVSLIMKTAPSGQTASEIRLLMPMGMCSHSKMSPSDQAGQ